MTHKEAVIFSLQLTTVFAEHIKIISDVLKKHFALTYSEFVLLYAICSAEAPAFTNSLSDFLMLHKKTVLAILLSLEDRELVIKKNFETDSRIMIVEPSSRGRELTMIAAKETSSLLKDVFWNTLPENDFTSFMRYNMHASMDNLRGFAVPDLSGRIMDSTLFPVDFFIFWKTVVRQWSDITQKESGLSFNEYRMLSLLKEFDLLSPSDISGRLLIPRSAVTLYKNKLLLGRLILEAPHPLDKRGVILKCTSKGKKLIQRIEIELNSITRLSHELISDEGIMILNAWYLRMYSNLQARYCR